MGEKRQSRPWLLIGPRALRHGDFIVVTHRAADSSAHVSFRNARGMTIRTRDGYTAETVEFKSADAVIRLIAAAIGRRVSFVGTLGTRDAQEDEHRYVVRERTDRKKRR
jgi:hypothetical protein